MTRTRYYPHQCLGACDVEHESYPTFEAAREAAWWFSYPANVDIRWGHYLDVNGTARVYYYLHKED